jgi:LPXTG-motif cell wall-anchored protein
LTAGQTVDVTVDGATAGESVDVTLHSTPMDLGTVIASGSGIVDFTFTVPTDLPAGAHNLIFTDANGAVLGDLAFTANAAPAGGGALAATGTDVRGLLVVGLVLLVGGAVLTVAARRRRPVGLWC